MRATISQMKEFNVVRHSRMTLRENVGKTAVDITSEISDFQTSAKTTKSIRKYSLVSEKRMSCYSQSRNGNEGSNRSSLTLNPVIVKEREDEIKYHVRAKLSKKSLCSQLCRN